MAAAPASDARRFLLSRACHASLIVLVCFLMEALTLSSRSFFAVIMVTFEDEFDSSRTVVSALRSLQLIVQALATPVGGQLADLFPRTTLCVGLSLCGGSLLLAATARATWQLFLTYGFLAGIGYGCCATGAASPVGISITTKYEIFGTLASVDQTWYHRSAIS